MHIVFQKCLIRYSSFLHPVIQFSPTDSQDISLLQNALEPMQVDIHPEDNDNYEEEQEHVVDSSNLVSYT